MKREKRKKKKMKYENRTDQENSLKCMCEEEMSIYLEGGREKEEMGRGRELGVSAIIMK